MEGPAIMPVPTEYDAQGKPIPATAAPSSPATEYDASGQPIAAPNMQPHGAPGNIFTSGHPLETLRANYDDGARPSNASDGGAFSRGLHDLGRGFTETLAGPIVHPLDTIKGIGSTIGGMAMHPDRYDPENPINKMVGNTVEDFQDNGAAKAIPHLAGQIGGGAIGGEVAGPVLGAMAKPLRALGAPMERGGLGAINHALEVTPKMMKYGQNPARGLVDEGIAPSMSKFSLANKLEPAVEGAGERVGSAVRNSPFDVPISETDSSIEGPLNSTRNIMQGPGGGRSTAPIDALHDSMTGRAPGASRPIYGEGAGRPFSAQGVGQAMGSRGLPRLMAPEVDTPLHSSPDIEGTASRPITLNQVDRPMRLGLPSPSGDVPMAPGMQEEFPERLASGTSSIRLNSPEGVHPGMGAGQYIGEIPGERGALGSPQGVLRQRMSFPESSEPSPFMDMRHPVSSPNDVWQTIQNIDRNTRFNPDPEVEGVNEVRRDIRGGLRGNLEDAVPGLKPLSERYGDLRTADDALSRTAGRGGPLKSVKDLFTFPAETAGGTALVRGGRMLQKIPSNVPGASSLFFAPKRTDQ
jgi:hypothetical protein